MIPAPCRIPGDGILLAPGLLVLALAAPPPTALAGGKGLLPRWTSFADQKPLPRNRAHAQVEVLFVLCTLLAGKRKAQVRVCVCVCVCVCVFTYDPLATREGRFALF